MNLQTFNEILETSFDFEGLSPEEIQESKEHLQSMIFENALLRLMDVRDLSQKQFNSFQKNVLAEDSVEKRIEFLQQEFPEFPQFIYKEVQELQMMPA